MASKIEVVFSFDTTGSMYPCLTQVRKNVKSTVKTLFAEVPGIRIGIIAHGDYCDKGSTYVTKHLKLTNDVDKIVKFVETVKATGGGDAPECYELVLKEAQDHPWTAAATKALVVIGDDLPHSPSDNPGKIDWRKEAKALRDAGIIAYAVQALNVSYATKFYSELASLTGGYHVPLDQFSYVTDLVLAVSYRQAGPERLKRYEEEVTTRGRMNRGLDRIFSTLQGRKAAKTFGKVDLAAVPPGRFQVLDVDHDVAIKKFTQENGLTFETGRGFYEFTKKETIQEYKEIILMDRTSGDLYAGDKARELLGLPVGESATIRPTDLEKYVVFVQSTSVNRVLQGGTRFLYEVEGWDRDGTAKKTSKKAEPKASTASPPKAKATVAKPAAKGSGGKKAAAGRRRFENTEGTSSKFWEVWTKGSDVCTHYGRIGGEGKTTVKKCADAAAAGREAEKRIGEKTRKGYAEA